MAETKEGSMVPQPEKKNPTQPLKMWEISSRVAHEPGSDNQQLAWIENQMSKLKVGENFEWTTDAEDVLKITKVDEEHYTLTFPEGYEWI